MWREGEMKYERWRKTYHTVSFSLSLSLPLNNWIIWLRFYVPFGWSVIKFWGGKNMEENRLCQWSAIRSILSILQWWMFNVTVIIMNKWIFQVSLLILYFCFPCNLLSTFVYIYKYKCFCACKHALWWLYMCYCFAGFRLFCWFHVHVSVWLRKTEWLTEGFNNVFAFIPP